MQTRYCQEDPAQSHSRVAELVAIPYRISEREGGRERERERERRERERAVLFD